LSGELGAIHMRASISQYEQETTDITSVCSRPGAFLLSPQVAVTPLLQSRRRYRRPGGCSVHPYLPFI
jgi:hypothetical protein